MACKYKDCNEPVNSPHDDEHCIFHAPKEKKGITVEEFNKLIWRRLNSRWFNFKGFIFPGDISFRGECKKSGGPIAFAEDTYFYDVQFLGKADFSEVQFLGNAGFIESQFSGDASFRKAQFSGDADFSESQFSGDAYFRKSQFSGVAYFSKAQFSGDAYFVEAQFSGNAYFSQARFSKVVYFDNCNFKKYVSFKLVDFKNLSSFLDVKFHYNVDYSNVIFYSETDFSYSIFYGEAYFSNTQFNRNGYFNSVGFLRNIIFDNNIISGSLHFSQAYFENRSIFYFNNPVFQILEKSSIDEDLLAKRIKLIFEKVRFNPFAAHFENIGEKLKNKQEKDKRDVFYIFRYCQLKDVYFTNNDMSLFSFYKSSFDQARFISSDWSLKKDTILKIFNFDRKNIIPEEKFYEDIRFHKDDNKYVAKQKRNHRIEDLSGYEDISSLYRQMKTALDNTKDYQQASWFYFNEFEMKRKALQEYFTKKLQEKVCLSETTFNLIAHYCRKFFSKLSLYNLYKTFAGYGEKPMWSFLWFGLGVLGFTILNYCLGLKRGEIQEGGTIKYLDTGIWDSFIFTLYRIIPANYLPYKHIYDIPNNFWGMLIPFLNTAVLILFIAFMAIGLKRHFRRF